MDDMDIEDFTVIHYGRQYVLRGSNGRYLTAVVDDSAASASGPSDVSKPVAVSSYYLGVHGQGIGETTDAISFVNLDNKFVFKILRSLSLCVSCH